MSPVDVTVRHGVTADTPKPDRLTCEDGTADKHVPARTPHRTRRVGHQRYIPVVNTRVSSTRRRRCHHLRRGGEVRPQSDHSTLDPQRGSGRDGNSGSGGGAYVPSHHRSSIRSIRSPPREPPEQTHRHYWCHRPDLVAGNTFGAAGLNFTNASCLAVRRRSARRRDFLLTAVRWSRPRLSSDTRHRWRAEDGYARPGRPSG